MSILTILITMDADGPLKMRAQMVERTVNFLTGYVRGYCTLVVLISNLD